MSEQIEIADVRDFLRVPPEKLEHCLEDFRGWLSVARAVEAIVAVSPGASESLRFGPFVWIDDGEHNATITIKTTEEAP